MPFVDAGKNRHRPGDLHIATLQLLRPVCGIAHNMSHAAEGAALFRHDGQAIRHFVGIDLNGGSAPDATTLLNFRRLLETHQLPRKIFDIINADLAEKGLIMREGTIVDATLIAAPPSTKNRDKQRDGEMHQSKKGNDGHFGMKAHIGVDADSGLVHTVIGTAGNVADITQAHALLHGDEATAFGDAGYQIVACLCIISS
jgi:transposase, IS5 family